MDDRIDNATRPLGHVPVESLGEGYDADLVALDELLSRNAARTSIPRDLADLVYDVTVGLVLERRPAPLRLTRAAPMWSRLAMAAGLALAFTIAAWSLNTQRPDVERRVAKRLPASVEQMLLEDTGASPFIGTSGTSYVDVAPMLDSVDASYSDIASEVDQLINQMEL